MIGTGFNTAAGDRARSLFEFAANPFAGLIIGTLATALIQSSTTVTSIIVGLVAGGVPVSTAIPMVMGANIATTLTSTIVSLGHVHACEEFRRAFAAATIHDMYNVLSVAILFPLELIFHPLERITILISQFMLDSKNIDMAAFDFMRAITRPTARLVTSAFSYNLPELFAGLAMIVIGILMILFVVTYIGRLLRRLMVGKAKAILEKAIARGPIAGIIAGAIITLLVQSSTTTTSLIVPFAATGVFTLEQIYSLTLGANVGTTVTAVLAATAISGEAGLFALQIALVHLTYNILSLLIVYGVPFLRNLPIWGARKLAEVALKQKLYVLAYVLGLYIIIPGILLVASKAMGF
jgi:sodium-dependent phosphate cotransporter